MTTRVSAASLEYLRVTVTLTPTADPTTNEVKIAIPAVGVAPIEDDWVDAEWETGGPPYVARILIGPTADTIPEPGTYDVWLQVADGDEIPAFPADRLIVYGAADDLLATVSDLADTLGKALDPEDRKALQHLQSVSGAIRRRSTQWITFVEEDEQELVGNWTRRLWLPQRPVVDVCSLEWRPRWDTEWLPLVIDSDVRWTRDGMLLRTTCSDWGGPEARIRAVYDHGLLMVPPELVGVACSMTARKMRDPSGAMASENLLSYAYQAAVDGSGAPIGITTEEAAIIDAFKPVPRE